MSERDRTRPDLLDKRPLRARCAVDREWHYPPAVQEEQPANRPPERQVALPVVERGVPPHRLRKREGAQQAGQDIREDVHRGLSAHLLAEGQIGALRRLEPLEGGHFDVVLFGETGGCGCGLAARVEGGRHRWPGDQLLEVCLALRQLPHPHGEAPRRAERLDRRRRRQAQFLQSFIETRRQL